MSSGRRLSPGLFPKDEEVRAHEQALSLARLDRTAADKDVTRLEAITGVNVAAAFAGARRRWQADEARKAAEAEKRDNKQAVEDAQARLEDAGGRVVREEAALRQALLTDASRLEAWGALFAIFALINFRRSVCDQPRVGDMAERPCGGKG